MFIKCTGSSIKSLIELISNDHMKKIKIDISNGFYYANYDIDMEKMFDIKLNDKVKAINILNDFKDMLLVGAIKSFYLFYDLETGVTVYNSSYSKALDTVTRDNKLTVLIESLNKVKELSLDLDVDDALIKNLYKKSLRQPGVKQQPGVAKGTRFDETTLGYSIDRIIESVK